MSAKFTNTNRGEYSQEADAASSGAPPRRVVYASWRPDQLTLAVNWVRQFKERIEGFDYDDADVLLHSKVRDEPEEAGAVRATTSEAIASALGDVTDFVVVATAAYFSAQKKQGQCELGWIVESASSGARNVIWVAALEPKLSFRGRKAGDHDLSVFSAWHPTKSESDPLEPYTFFRPEDLDKAVQFAGELNAAVDRIRGHSRECRFCLHAKQRP